MSNLGFIRIAVATPKLKPANTKYNTEQIIKCLETANTSGSGIIVFPELCITGATCGDIFYQDLLYKNSLKALEKILLASKKTSQTIVLGLYVNHSHYRFNCACVIQNGEIKGLVPKMYMPNAQARWFTSGSSVINQIKSVRLLDADIPFGNLLFKDFASDAVIGIEVAEDVTHAITPSASLALCGANVILNPSAISHTVGKSERLHALIINESRKNSCAYVYASAGVHESTTDMIHSGQNIIAENGALISESDLFNRDSNILYGDIDIEAICSKRKRTSNFNDVSASHASTANITTVELKPLSFVDVTKQKVMRTYRKNPFLPDSPLHLAKRCGEIFEMQCAGLAKRIEHTNASKSVIGISGGIDSTLALLVCAGAYSLLGRNTSEILTVTMPGFGTTDKTYQNAIKIMQLLGTEIREISISDAVVQHFKDIGHDINVHDVTYENSQARERTQILMDVANKENGLVIGTGDLSEAALGWCTFNGDHMSMYNVNAGVPKTVAMQVIKWIVDYKLNGPLADTSFSFDNAELSYALEDILNTPISPELLPPDASDSISQKTEDFVGPYILHDFFIFYAVNFGFSSEKISYLAELAFAGDYSSEEIKKWLGVFYRRFFSQQFKRNCMPDGLKIGSVSLSPRGSLVMPSDADFELD